MSASLLLRPPSAPARLLRLDSGRCRTANNYVLLQVLHDYFAWATTTTMARCHQSADDVPNKLSIPKWSWDGLQV